MHKVDLEAQGRDTTFTLCHVQLKKAVLYLKRANVSFLLSICVSFTLKYQFCAGLDDIKLMLKKQAANDKEFWQEVPLSDFADAQFKEFEYETPESAEELNTNQYQNMMTNNEQSEE